MKSNKNRVAIMFLTKITWLLITLCVTLVACSQPTIDAENPEESIEQIKESLSSDEREQFEDAMEIVASNILADAFGNILGGGDVNLDPETALQDVDGMTAGEVISYADSIRQAREERAREQAHQEIKELSEKRAEARAAQSQLEDFTVERSRFYKRERRWTSDDPIIEVTVTNNTEHAISRAYFEGVIASPSREVPYLEKRFNYSIPGGIEPGETQEWNLAPNRFSEWGRVDMEGDMVFTATPYRVDDASGDPLFEADFSERDAKRLQSLLEEYGEP